MAERRNLRVQCEVGPDDVDTLQVDNANDNEPDENTMGDSNGAINIKIENETNILTDNLKRVRYALLLAKCAGDHIRRLCQLSQDLIEAIRNAVIELNASLYPKYRHSQ